MLDLIIFSLLDEEASKPSEYKTESFTALSEAEVSSGPRWCETAFL